MSLSLSLLGTVDVRRDGVPVSDFRSQSVRALLAYLALEADRPHEREHLCALLWPGEPIQTALTNLRQALHRLRQTIEPAPEDEGRYLLITRQSVQLNPAAIQTDIAHFQAVHEAVAAHRHRSAASCERCAGQIRAALGYYRGDLLAGFSLAGSEPFEDWLEFEREWLRGQLSGLLDLLAAYHERRGELDAALDLLRRWAQIEPLSEQAQLRLIAALTLRGQRAHALRQFERYRSSLAAELGIEPGHAVIELARRLRSGELPPATARTLRHLPADASPFIGRARELARLGDLLGDPACRLLTITGLGGSGKTRLAIVAAQAACYAFADGGLFVSLTTVRNVRQVPELLASALGLFALPGRPLVDQIIEELRGRELLLVLDNCEQVLELAGLLARLLTAAPGLTVLATSRAALDLRAEWVVPIEGLALAPPAAPAPDPESYAAGQFFLLVARQLRPDFSPGPAEAALVLECCRLLGGTPLGIELAASQLRTRRLAEIVAGVRADINSLATTMGDLTPRHRSLRAVFDWSWRLLDPLEQQTLARLAVFAGGGTRSAALAVCGEAAPLEQLVSKSLLHRDVDGHYWMHEQTRQFAEEHLNASADASQAHAQHSAYYLSLAASQAALIDGPQASAIIARLQVKRGNLIRAWSWAARNSAYRLLAAAAPVFQQIYARSDLVEGVVQFSYALAWIQGDDEESVYARRQLLDALVVQLRSIGRYQDALERAQELLALAKASGDPVSEVVGTLHLADLALDHGDFAGAWDYLTLANKLSIDEPSRRARKVKARALLKQASLIDSQQLPVDTSFAERAYAIYAELEMPTYASVALNRLGNQYRRLGDYGRSIEARLHAVALIADQGDHELSTVVLNDLGEIYLLLGCYNEAQAAFAQALAMARRLGATKSEVTILEGLARCLLHLGDPGAARAHIEEALAVEARRPTQMHRGYYLTTLGYAAERAGDCDAAGAHYLAALRWWEQSGHSSDALTEPHAGLMRVALAHGQPRAALAHAEAVLPFLERAPLQDALEPMWVHLSCYQALLAARDRRAAAVLAHASRLLHGQAAQISDPQMRSSFLSGVAAHRAILAADARRRRRPGRAAPRGPRAKLRLSHLYAEERQY